MRIEITGHKSDPSTAWERLGDTDFMNRRADGGGVTYELVPTEGGAPRIRGAMAGPAGLSMGFEETYNGWVRERWFRQERAYEGGPLAHSRFLLSFEADGDGVVPHIQLDLEPRMRLLAPAISLRGRTIQSRWKAILDALPQPGERRGAEARSVSAPLRAALDRWRPSAPAPLVDAMEEALRSEREQELRSMRAYGLADRLGLDRREVLAAMLRAVPEGLLEVYWSVRCTRCQGELGATTSLSNLADHADCVSCGIQVSTDLGRSVEVLFAPHPSVFPRSEDRFCTLFPSGAPSLVAAFPLEPGTTAREALAVEVGEHLALGVGQGRDDIDVRVSQDGGHAIQWSPEVAAAAEVAAGELVVEAHNTTDARQRLVLRDTDADRHVVMAADVATVPVFRRQLGPEILASRVRVGSRRIALLFTDLSGSTALYEEVGDAVAYSLVRDHFDLVRREVEAHGGEVVKTIGDAVMASFERVDEALRAGHAMRTAFDRWMAEAHRERAVRLNVGVHVGMALGVHTDALGLDWFGQNVNLAARAQGAAHDGDLVITGAVHHDALVVPMWGDLGKPEAFEVELKGIGATELYRWRRPD